MHNVSPPLLISWLPVAGRAPVAACPIVPAHLCAVEVAVEARWSVGHPWLALSLLTAAGIGSRHEKRGGGGEGTYTGAAPTEPLTLACRGFPRQGCPYLASCLVCTMEAQSTSIPARRTQAEMRRKRRMTAATTRVKVRHARLLRERGADVSRAGTPSGAPAPHPAHR